METSTRTWKTLFIDILFMAVGCAMLGLSLALFTVPNHIAPGGVSGLSTALAYISPLRVSLWSLILNVPLLLFALRRFGGMFFSLTLLSTAMLSLFIELFAAMPGYTGNPLMAAMFGGALSGAGIGLLFLRNLSSGGTDLLALMLQKPFPNLPHGTLLLFADAAVVVAAVIIFRDIEVALYSTVTIIVSSKVIDALTQGVDFAKVIFTVTERGERVNAALMSQTERGATFLPARGSYTNANKAVIITVTKRRALSQTLGIIKQADPDSFTFVMSSTQVHGNGFKTH